MRDHGTYFVTKEIVDEMIKEVLRKFIKENHMEGFVDEFKEKTGKLR